MRPLLALLLSASFAFAQSPTPGNGAPVVPVSPALQLLREVGDKYANAKSYWFETVEEETRTQELQRNWSKVFLMSAEAPGGSFRFEGRDSMSDSGFASDGSKDWHWRALEKAYTETQAEKDSATKQRSIVMGDYAAVRAKFLKKQLQQVASHLKDAHFLPDEDVQIDGKTFHCKVVQFTSADFAKTSGNGDHLTSTIWINRDNNTLVKLTEVGESEMFGPDRKHPIPFHDDRVILYKKAVVDATFPADFFRFRPPVDAALVAKFDDGMPDFDKLRTDLIGKPAPATELKAEDGKSFTLASLKGKPVLLDLWATWCAPCVEAIPELKKLNAELKPTSLQWFSVDINDDPKVVGELLKKEKISWTNLHDSSGLLLQSFHTPGIPSAILIDADGKVLYIGGELKDLRSAIAKLGTEYAPIASATAEPSAKTP